MMYLLKKSISGFNYYWNDRFKTWEGLRDNATPLLPEEFNILSKRANLTSSDGELISHEIIK